MADLPEVDVDGALELFESDVDQTLDGVRVVEPQRVALGLVLLGLLQVVLQLHTTREGEREEVRERD